MESQPFFVLSKPLWEWRKGIIPVSKTEQYKIKTHTFTTCFSLKVSISATSCEELTHWKRLWCWEGLGTGREGDNRGWNGWIASPTRWTWVWVNSGSWWWTGRPGMLRFMGSQRVRHNWATELNWTELQLHCAKPSVKWLFNIHCFPFSNHLLFWLLLSH